MTTTADTVQASSNIGMITGLTLALEVSDLERSKKFYKEVLGFRFSYEVTEIGWCEFESPTKDVTIGLSKVQTVTSGSGLVPTFNVSDIAHTRSLLESKNVRFDGPTNTMPGMVMLATFFDPDGHPFMLAQSLAMPN
jgi:CreA protein